MKTWDAIIIGAGVIGLSLARELRKHRARVAVVERGEPGRGASHAAAGMLAPWGAHLPEALRSLAQVSFEMYGEFVHQLEDEAGEKVDLRGQGAIATAEELGVGSDAPELSEGELKELEPCLAYRHGLLAAQEKSVDPRALVSALLKASKHRGIHIAHGSAATVVRRIGAQLSVKSERTEFVAPVVVNCCGAWAGGLQIQGSSMPLPVRPVKGQMLSVAAPHKQMLRHVVRTREVYLVPRSDGRILIGATVEEAGYDKRVDPDIIQDLHQRAANLVPELGEARMLEAWAGLRPATPDALPVLGTTDVAGYYVASGHFRNGILLAPVNAAVIASLIEGSQPPCDIAPFSAERFARPSVSGSSPPALKRTRASG